MQHVRLINPNGLEADFTLDRVDGAPSTFVFNTIYGTGRPEAEISELSVPEQDGAYFESSLLRARDLEFNAYVTGEDQAAMYAALEHLSRVITTRPKEQLRIEYANDHGRWYVLGTAQSQEYAERIQAGYHFKPVAITLHCPRPYWLAADGGDGAQIEYTPSMFFFPFAIVAPGVCFGDGGYRGTLTNRGNTDAPVQISLNGPAVRPEISNLTTGQRIELALSLMPYETLKINTAKGDKYVRVHNHVTGQTHDVWDTLEFGPDIALWALAPGENVITYRNDRADVTGAVLTVAWESPLTGV